MKVLLIAVSTGIMSFQPRDLTIVSGTMDAAGNACHLYAAISEPIFH